MFRVGLFLSFFILFGFLMCQSDTPKPVVDMEEQRRLDSIAQAARIAEENRQKEEAWVNEQFALLDTEEKKLGQLFMVAAYPEKGSSSEQKVLKLIKDHHVGGVIFFKGNPTTVARQSNLYQAKSSIPLLTAMDAEWGISMRMDSVLKYPRQMLLGGIQDNRLLYEMGKEVAFQCRRIGINVNFAPVVDVNNNMDNPVIGDRSFGEDRDNVAVKGFQYMKGLQDHQVLACAKHFPGHGDTDVDSHKDLPIINHDMNRLDSLELYPFKALIQHGIGSIMIAHLNIPSIDTTENIPITLSKNGIQKLLKDSLGYKGLAITDAMNMRGVTKFWETGEADARSIVAGTDIILMSQDVPSGISEVKKVIANGEVTWEDIDNRIKNILHTKYRVGLAEYEPVSTKNVVEDLNHNGAKLLRERLIAGAITLAKNDDDYLPIRQVNGKKIATLSIGAGRKNEFQRELDKYGIEKHYYTGSSIVGKTARNLKKLEDYETVIVSIERVGKLAKDDFNISNSVKEFVGDLSTKTRVIVTMFGNPYALQYFDSTQVVIAAYDDDNDIQRLTAQAVMGGIPFAGQMSVTAGNLTFGTGFNTMQHRMSYVGRPEDVGLSSNKLSEIDKIANEGIRKGAMPGCQVLVVKDGQIAFHKAYGHHTYRKKTKVELNNVYDLASVTKIAAATLTIMALYEQGKIDLDGRFADYLPALEGTNKANLTIRKVMAHHAQLKPWIPFYTKTLDDNKKPMSKFYKTSPQGNFDVRIMEDMYFDNTMIDSIVWQRIYDSALTGVNGYKYSDLGFYLFAPMIENITGEPLDQFVEKNFYQQMGLENIMYNPLAKGIDKDRIIPTEEDDYFRYGKVHGDVHDMGAAMIHGISGHAGLFATATDLAAVMQLFVDGGIYNNRRYLNQETIDLFTGQYTTSSRRGIGFDKKELNSSTESVNVAYQASSNTFGHLGFTGIGAWADPDSDIIFLFLSNRTYPDSENNKLNRYSIRSRIHEAIYNAII